MRDESKQHLRVRPVSVMKVLMATAALSLVSEALGHGAVVKPPPRNAVDKDLPPWNGPVHSTPSVESKTGFCPSVDENGNLTYANGQSCFCERSFPLSPLSPYIKWLS